MMDYLSALPNEIQFHLLRMLDLPTLESLCSTSKQWRTIINGEDNKGNQFLWKELYLRDFCLGRSERPHDLIDDDNENFYWKESFQEKYKEEKIWQQGPSRHKEILDIEGDVLTSFWTSKMRLACGGEEGVIYYTNFREQIENKSTSYEIEKFYEIKCHSQTILAVDGLIEHMNQDHIMTSDQMRLVEILATGSCDKTIRIWNIKSCVFDLLATLQGHTQAVTCVRFLKSEKEHNPEVKFIETVYNYIDYSQLQLLSASRDGIIIRWNLMNNQEISRFVGHQDEITGFDVALHNKTLVSASIDKSVRVWDLDTCKCLRILSFEWVPQSLQVHFDHVLVVGSMDLRIYDINSGEMVHSVESDRTIFSAHFDGSKLITTAKNRMSVYRIFGRHRIEKMWDKNVGWVTHFHFTNSYILSVCFSGAVEVHLFEPHKQ